MRKILALTAIAFCLFLSGCGTDYRVSGVVTSTGSYSYTYPCGKSMCFGIHHTFVVDGQNYTCDDATVEKGDNVTFTYNTVWGVSHFHDGTYHPQDDETWLLVILVVVVIAIVVGGGVVFFREAAR